MIDYLKESTFAVKDVVLQAWKVTKDNYFSIATLCFLIFITASTSTFMALFTVLYTSSCWTRSSICFKLDPGSCPG